MINETKTELELFLESTEKYEPISYEVNKGTEQKLKNRLQLIKAIYRNLKGEK